MKSTKANSDSRKRRRGVGIAAAVAGVALSLLAALPAQAVSNYPNLTIYPAGIPADAPKPVNGGDVIPQLAGTLGVPTVIKLSAISQAVTAGMPGTGVTTTPLVANGGDDHQRWYFQLAGIDTMSQVYRIINYTVSVGGGAAPVSGASSSGATASGSTGTGITTITCLTRTASAQVVTAACDPNNVGQYWLPSDSSSGKSVYNLPDDHTAAFPALQAANTLTGHDSPLRSTVISANQYPNAQWQFLAINPPKSDPGNQDPNCSMFGCLITWW
jgi:hypothetical protein